MTRFDQFRDQYMEKSLAAPSSQSKYFWFDTVNGNPSALRCACDTLDTGKIMLGTDFPYWADDALQEEVEYVKQPAIAPHVEEAIYTANARRLLGLKT
jgi:predicted TIM-barrel fold metal-dependent hydrolase